MSTPKEQAVMNYAKEAFCVVLDQHELFVLPTQVQAIPISGGGIVLLYEVQDHSAAGRFDGELSDGTITLEEVKTPHWKKRFGTVDRFKDAYPDGTPTLVAPTP